LSGYISETHAIAAHSCCGKLW